VSPESRLLLGLLVALLATYALTPLAIRAASRWGFHDLPVGYKTHRRATPYLGGAAVVAGFLLALAALAAAVDGTRTLALAGSVLVLWAVGTIDDRRTVSPGLRVVVELLLAAGIWAAGLGWDSGATLVDLPLTMFWVVLVVNAFNLFDNMDGASGTLAFVVATSAGILGLVEGNAWLAAGGGALAGACLGFLPYNLTSPARIFLGDGGSMPIGFAAAVLVMAGTSDALPAPQAIPVAVVLVGVAVLDTALVIVSRRRRRVSILTGGHDHLTYRVRDRLGTPRRVAVTLGGAQALLAILAIGATQGSPALVAAATTIYLLAAVGVILRLEPPVWPRASRADAQARRS
jgi:UDP-GlcNAc:undecaprenyl-phosphate GlcNAc-1-phosphate transferase